MGATRKRRISERCKRSKTSSSNALKVRTKNFRLRNIEIKVVNCCRTRHTPNQKKIRSNKGFSVCIKKVDLCKFINFKRGLFFRQPKVLLKHIGQEPNSMEDGLYRGASNHLIRRSSVDKGSAVNKLLSARKSNKTKDKSENSVQVRKPVSRGGKVNSGVTKSLDCRACLKSRGKENCQGSCPSHKQTQKPVRRTPLANVNAVNRSSCRTSLRISTSRASRMNEVDSVSTVTSSPVDGPLTGLCEIIAKDPKRDVTEELADQIRCGKNAADGEGPLLNGGKETPTRTSDDVSDTHEEKPEDKSTTDNQKCATLDKNYTVAGVDNRRRSADDMVSNFQLNVAILEKVSDPENPSTPSSDDCEVSDNRNDESKTSSENPPDLAEGDMMEVSGEEKMETVDASTTSHSSSNSESSRQIEQYNTSNPVDDKDKEIELILDSTTKQLSLTESEEPALIEPAERSVATANSVDDLNQEKVTDTPEETLATDTRAGSDDRATTVLVTTELEKKEETEQNESNESVKIVIATVTAVIDAVPAICDKLSGEKILEKVGDSSGEEVSLESSKISPGVEGTPCLKRKRGRPRKLSSTESNPSLSNKKIIPETVLSPRESQRRVRLNRSATERKDKDRFYEEVDEKPLPKSKKVRKTKNQERLEKKDDKNDVVGDKVDASKIKSNGVKPSSKAEKKEAVAQSKKRKKDSDDEEKVVKSKVQNGVGKNPPAVNKKATKVKVGSEKSKANSKVFLGASDEESEEEVILSKEDKQEIKKMEEFLVKANLNLVPYPYTKGDGNCWFRAMADQVVLLNIEDKPRNHKEMRQAVADFLKDLPVDVKKNTIEVVFLGKPRGLSDLAHRQRKLGQWVDDKGVMVLATALYLRRNINIFAYPADNSRDYNVTSIEGGVDADKRPSVNVFFDRNHYQSLKSTSTSSTPQSDTRPSN